MFDKVGRYKNQHTQDDAEGTGEDSDARKGLWRGDDDKTGQQNKDYVAQEEWPLGYMDVGFLGHGV